MIECSTMKRNSSNWETLFFSWSTLCRFCVSEFQQLPWLTTSTLKNESLIFTFSRINSLKLTNSVLDFSSYLWWILGSYLVVYSSYWSFYVCFQVRETKFPFFFDVYSQVTFQCFFTHLWSNRLEFIVVILWVLFLLVRSKTLEQLPHFLISRWYSDQ